MLDMVFLAEFFVVGEYAGGFADGAELVGGRGIVAFQFGVADE